MQNAAPQLAHRPNDAEQDRQAYNAAFDELGLAWIWDTDTHRRLQGNADERDRIRSYLTAYQAHLFTAYDADFLVNAIHLTKQKRVQMLQTGLH